MALARHRRWTYADAERLLNRFGTGATPAETARYHKLGMDAAIKTLLRTTGNAKLIGPQPHDDDGRTLAPKDIYGQDHLALLDRLVRSNQPGRERMALVLHDWLVVSNSGVGNQRLMLQYQTLLRKYAFGSFRPLIREMTKNPAMLLFLSGTANNKYAPNENYARELMELFTLGADARYTERDIREASRALTGWSNDWGPTGATNFRFKPDMHDTGSKKIFGKRGNFDWKDVCELCVNHRDHPRFVVNKLWEAFVPKPMNAATRAGLIKIYRTSKERLGPVVEAIAAHPDVYLGPRMLKPPIIYIAQLLKLRGEGVQGDKWTWIAGLNEQMLNYPPNVAGWDESSWLTTGSWRARWYAANYAMEQVELKNDSYRPPDGDTTEQLVDRVVAFWGNPVLSEQTRSRMMSYAQDTQTMQSSERWKATQYPALRENALRQMLAVSPDMLSC